MTKIQYTKEVIDFLEASYGEDMLSPGGKTIDILLKNKNFKDKKILDIGSGLGGVNINIAKKTNCKIIGVDIEDLVINIAKKKLKKQDLIGEIEYIKCGDIKELKEDKFDLVFSKECILHIKNKKYLFDNILKKLKKGGEVIIIDWFHKNKNYSKEMQRFLEHDGLEINLIKVEEYIKLLKIVGFQDVKYEDLTELTCEETKNVLNKTKKEIALKLKKRFGEEYYNTHCIPSWQQQITLMSQKEIIVGKISAKKQ